jgi:hypothetical protein
MLKCKKIASVINISQQSQLIYLNCLFLLPFFTLWLNFDQLFRGLKQNSTFGKYIDSARRIIICKKFVFFSEKSLICSIETAMYFISQK